MEVKLLCTLHPLNFCYRSVLHCPHYLIQDLGINMIKKNPLYTTC